METENWIAFTIEGDRVGTAHLKTRYEGIEVEVAATTKGVCITVKDGKGETICALTAG